MVYDPALSTDRDWMRNRLGDTDDATPIAPDATYDAYLADAGDDWRMAAAGLARSFASQDARKAQSIQGDPGTINWGDRAKKWLAIAAELEAEATRLRRADIGLWDAAAERVDLIDSSAEYSISLRRV